MDFSRRILVEERMDAEITDYAEYARCLRDLSRVNVVTLTHRTTLSWLAERTRELKPRDTFSLLDVAFGRGDGLRAVARWAEKRGFTARLAGVDLNPQAARAAREATPPELAIEYHTGDLFDFAPAEPFDYVVSSEFAHHLTDDGVVAFVRWMERTARKGWFVCDLHRHQFAYYGFPLLARAMFWHPVVRGDGQISIGRSFRAAEWRALLERAGVPEAHVGWRFPFRYCVARNKAA
jgi:2-polyprenyl-3-methyl-5-hydroxy-6-metoxy-1,4-benzoquinol methylase